MPVWAVWVGIKPFTETLSFSSNLQIAAIRVGLNSWGKEEPPVLTCMCSEKADRRDAPTCSLCCCWECNGWRAILVNYCPHSSSGLVLYVILEDPDIQVQSLVLQLVSLQNRKSTQASCSQAWSMRGRGEGGELTLLWDFSIPLK